MKDPGVCYINQNALSRANDLVGQARDELIHFSSPEVDLDRIWRAYCKLEMAMAIAKFAHEEFKIGKRREIKFSSKDDPTKMSHSELELRFKKINSKLRSCQERFKYSNILSGIELGRQARDELKVLIGSHTKQRSLI